MHVMNVVATQNTILIVEDDDALAQLMGERLSKEGFLVSIVCDGLNAQAAIRNQNPDLVVLDIMLPGIDGFEVCRRVRPEFKGAVLMLTARDGDIDHVLGLELGADDFVVKPVRPRILIARIRALLRRTQKQVEDHCAPVINVGDLQVDASRREASFKGKPVELTTLEFDLLRLLAEKAGAVMSRNDIHLAVYGTPYDGLERSIDVYISRLRQKLGDDPANPQYLKTVRGAGYMLVGDKS